MSPKSHVQSPRPAAAPGKDNSSASIANVGHWTLDVELPGSLDLGAGSPNPALTVTDLRKSFLLPSGKILEVLRGISFSAQLGQTVAVTGASGAGKSTLLHLFGGLEAPDHGSIAFGDFAIDRASPSSLAKFRSRNIGFVFQFHHLLADLSAAENVALPLLISRIDREQAMRRAAQALADVGLKTRGNDAITHLSGGEQQRVAICRALIMQPTLVLADEPTGNLDASFAAELGERLVNYSRQRGAIVIMATHNERLAQVSDRTVIIHDGRLSDV